MGRPYKEWKIVAVNLVLPPSKSIRQNSGRGCLDARNQKEVNGATKPYGDPKILVSILSGMVLCFGSIVFPGHWKGLDQPLVIGLKLPLLVLDGGGFLYGYSILT